jgi:glycosyltransferase involved in cell wall biosynthesis
LLDNDELRRSFGRAGREAVERYRWANVADAVSALYEEVLADGEAPPPRVIRELGAKD